MNYLFGGFYSAGKSKIWKYEEGFIVNICPSISKDKDGN